MKTKPQKTFRSLPKEMISLTLPVAIVTAIRESAAKTRRPLNNVATEALADHLGLDLERFGLGKPRKQQAAV